MQSFLTGIDGRSYHPPCEISMPLNLKANLTARLDRLHILIASRDTEPLEMALGLSALGWSVVSYGQIVWHIVPATPTHYLFTLVTLTYGLFRLWAITEEEGINNLRHRRTISFIGGPLWIFYGWQFWVTRLLTLESSTALVCAFLCALIYWRLTREIRFLNREGLKHDTLTNP